MYLHGFTSFLIVLSITIEVNGRNHRYEWFKRESLSTFTTAQQKFQRQMLDAHNMYRARHCVSLLKLDSELNRLAQNYAEYLARIHQLKHNDDEYLGENLFRRRTTGDFQDFTGADPTNSWYNEIAFYNFNQPGYSPETGHFTQMVWKETDTIGVGFAFTVENSQNTVYVVALYSPGGNFENYFADNVTPSKC